MKRSILILAILLILGVPSSAHDTRKPDPDTHVQVRVVDCGQGLCCLVRIPGGHYMIYDAGFSGKQSKEEQDAGMAEIENQVTNWITEPDASIDLLVISHSHDDHMRAMPWILNNYGVKSVWWTGFKKKANWWKETKAGIDTLDLPQIVEATNPLEQEGELNLSAVDDPEAFFGCPMKIGDAKVTLVCGWPDPSNWDGETGLASNDRENATSIVVKLEYAHESVLFSGDMLGKKLSSETSVAGEKYINNSRTLSELVDSDVLIAGHHGSKTSSSNAFLSDVSPRYVIFSAGHEYRHPTQSAMNRCAKAEVPWENMFRTDWGDNEGGLESSYGVGEGDMPGDDGVDIWLGAEHSGYPRVEWVDASEQTGELDEHVRPDEYP